MNARKIKTILESNPKTKTQFENIYGVTSILYLENGQGIIVNTAEAPTREQDGNICRPVFGHWVLFYKINDVLEFFDPLGKTPKYWSKYLDIYVKNEPTYVLAAGNEHLQSANSQLCGEYCIYYLYMRCCNESMENIIKGLRSITNNNIRDMFVKAYVRELETAASNWIGLSNSAALPNHQMLKGDLARIPRLV